MKTTIGTRTIAAKIAMPITKGKKLGVPGFLGGEAEGEVCVARFSIANILDKYVMFGHSPFVTE